MKNESPKLAWTPVIFALSIALIYLGSQMFDRRYEIGNAYIQNIYAGNSHEEAKELALKPFEPSEWNTSYEKNLAAGLSHEKARVAATEAIVPKIFEDIQNMEMLGKWIIRLGLLGIVYCIVKGIYKLSAWIFGLSGNSLGKTKEDEKATPFQT